MAPRVLLLVLAGGQGSRLGPLTDGQAKPSLPVGGTHRLVDLALSNAVNSGLSDVWVIAQFHPHALEAHLAKGRPWDLDRTRGGLRVVAPFQADGQRAGGFAEGNADALVRNWPAIAAFDPDVLLVASADHLVAMDLAATVVAHLDRGSDATVVTTTLPRGEDASRYLVVQTRGDKVSSVDYKPDDPRGREVGTEVFAYRPDVLVEHLHALDDKEGLGDYGERLLPALVEAGAVGAVHHDGYWRDLGTPEAYLDGNLDLIGPGAKIRLDDPAWPIFTAMPVRSPALVRAGAELERAWLAPGADVAGTVVHSIIGPGARVERGAVVRHSVVMADAVIRRGAHVMRTVVGDAVIVGHGSQLGAANARHPVLIGAGRRLAVGTVLDAGHHLDPSRSHRAAAAS